MFIRIFSQRLMLIMIASLAACTNDDEFQVERPSSIPTSAQFTGGIDGWNWVDCKSTSEIHLECKIYDQLGNLSVTSFVRPCFNLKVKDHNGIKISQIDETLITFKEIHLYEYKPSIFEGESDKSELALKYYNMFGVDDSCNRSSLDSELELVN